jgi:Asp-tRNA(Asn)/Glu-tRNA(Gln) amidotransferase A subunit family amidase
LARAGEGFTTVTVRQELNRLSATQAAAGIARGDFTAAALMAACLDRIAKREPLVHAFQTIDPDVAMRAAEEADRSESKGALHGVPFAAKDIIATADLPTGWGSPVYAHHRPPRDASCVQLLKDAGAVLIGKTVTTEFAYFDPGPTANPHNLAHTPGGSSSGSAAAVADFMVPLALGSQTAGSLIRPGAYCGVYAYKPTHGSFDLDGVMSAAASLDTLGGLARSVDDFYLLRAALCPNLDLPPVDPEWRPRVALMRGPHWAEGSMQMRHACQRAMAALGDAGAVVGELSPPAVFADLVAHQKTVMAYETARARIFEYRYHRDRVGEAFAKLVETGLDTTFADYRRALDAAARARRMHDTQFLEFDVILAPAAAGEAPKGLHATGDPLYSRAWTLLHAPAMSVPFGRGPNGLPLAVQLVGRRGADEAFLHAALWIDHRLNPSGTTPP